MKKTIFWVCGLVFAVLFAYLQRNALMGIAAVLAYAIVFSLMLSPLCVKIEKTGIRTGWAAGIAVVGSFLTVFFVFAAWIPYLAAQFVYLFRRISPVAAELMRIIQCWLDETGFLRMVFSDSERLMRLPLAEMAGRLAKAGMTVAAQIGRISFALVLTYYILCERNRLVRHLYLFLPVLWRRPVCNGIHACRNAIMSYFAGMMKTSVFVTIATFAGLVILGIEDALLLSLFMGIMEILPYLGPVIASVPILLSALAQGGEKFFPVLGVIVLVQQIEGNFINPYFTASSTSVRPLEAILGVFIIGGLLGMWGILLALPCMVLAKSIYSSYCQMRISIDELG